MINVTQPYLPSKEKYLAYVDKIYQSKWLTNNGPLVQELEKRLADYLGVKHLILVNNGSMALQVSYQALELKGEVLTTPFSFAATPNTLIWQNIKPIFSDIDKNTFNLDVNLIEKNITENTSAIVPVHVFGNPCEVEEIEKIASKYDLPIIYDAAHAFGVNYKGESILNYGLISTLSFHATKLFHTIEGGAIITANDEVATKVRKLINFGITSPTDIECAGTNGKMNEFEAAMGLCILDEIDNINNKREIIWKKYQQAFTHDLLFQYFNDNSQNNFAYAPILFYSEKQLLKVQKALNKENIAPRRYFYPSLDSLAYIDTNKPCPISNTIASRILCLPIYPDLSNEQQDHIIKIVIANL